MSELPFSSMVTQTWTTLSDEPIQTVEDGDPIGATLTEICIKAVVGVVLVLIILSAIIGNILVCLALSTDRRLRKLGNVFLASLALADLFVASLVMTFAVANDLMGYWVFGNFFCEIWIAFDISCCTCSIINLCAISLDRFMYIKDPLKYNRWMTKKVVLTAVAAIWLVSGLVSFLPIGLGWHRPDQPIAKIQTQLISNSTAGLLSVDQYEQCALELTPTYAAVSSTISFYLPCCIMIGLYAKLYAICKQHVKSIKSMTKPLNDGNGYSNNQHHISEHKAAITLGIIVGTFLACWTPFFCMNIYAPICKDCVPKIVFKVLTWLGYINSSLNPAIYSIFNTEFREAFRKVIFTYLLRDDCNCCLIPGRRGNYSPRSGTDLHQISGSTVANNTPAKHGRGSLNDRPHRSSGATACEFIPIRDKIEIAGGDGKIADI